MNEYYKNLPKKWMSVGALIFDNEGKFLIVKPTYKPTWEIPGGGIAEGESPLNALKREIKEELGLEITPGNLLCTEYIPNFDDHGDRVQFIFDGGVLDKNKEIELPKDELSEWKFVTLEDSLNLLGKKLHYRVPAAVNAKNKKEGTYLESFFENEKASS